MITAALLAQSDERYLALARTCGRAVLIESADKIVFANRECGELFGIHDARELLGMRLIDFIPSLARRGDEHPAGPGTFRPHLLAHAGGRVIDVEIACDDCGFEGRGATQMILRAAADHEHGSTEVPPAEGAIALRDRLAFRDRVAAAIAAGERSGKALAVMILAIDNLPSDSAPQGPAAAERVLTQISGRLVRDSRRSDAIAAVGPNQFAILVEAVGEPELAMLVAGRKLQTVSRPVALDTEEVRATASIGIAIHSRAVRDTDELIGNAHRALWTAQNDGGDGYRFHSEGIEDDARRHGGPRPETSIRLKQLTPRERQVLDMMVEGKASKVIAQLLGTSARTIDIHRARVMKKMHARSVASLVTMVLEDRAPRPNRRLKHARSGVKEASHR